VKEICSGENWEEIENWTESLDHYNERMTRFASRLNGSKRITHYSGESHDNCSRSSIFLEQIQKIYGTATVGLDLTTLGNHSHRTPVTSSGNAEKWSNPLTT
jgi:hypothetical protein